MSLQAWNFGKPTFECLYCGSLLWYIYIFFSYYHFMFDNYYANTCYYFCYYNSYLFHYCLSSKIYYMSL